MPLILDLIILLTIQRWDRSAYDRQYVGYVITKWVHLLINLIDRNTSTEIIFLRWGKYLDKIYTE